MFNKPNVDFHHQRTIMLGFKSWFPWWTDKIKIRDKNVGIDSQVNYKKLNKHNERWKQLQMGEKFNTYGDTCRPGTLFSLW